MNVTRWTWIGTAALVLGFASIAAAPAGADTSQTQVAQAKKALATRSQAMDRHYNAAALNALQVRSQAMDRHYHLGITRATAGSAAGAARALQIRGDALNRQYHLGRYTVVAARPDDFDWGDAGIGGAATLGLVVLAGALVVGARRFRHVQVPQAS